MTTTSFDWAEDVETAIAPTLVTFITPTIHAPRDFSGLHSDEQNPWSGLSRRHRRSHPRTQNICNSTRYPIYNHAPEIVTPSTPPPPPPPQLVETVRHPCRIAPTKPVIRTTALPPTTSPRTNPSMSAHVPVSTVSFDSSSRSLGDTLLDWSGDPLLAGLARILEALGWKRECIAARTPLCLRGAHGIVDPGLGSHD